MSRWLSRFFLLPSGAGALVLAFLELHQTTQSSNNKFCRPDQTLFVLAAFGLPFDCKRWRKRAATATKQKGTTAATNNRHGHTHPTLEKWPCYSQLLPSADASISFGFFVLYSSSFLIVQVGCCYYPASTLALVFDHLVALGELY